MTTIQTSFGGADEAMAEWFPELRGTVSQSVRSRRVARSRQSAATRAAIAAAADGLSNVGVAVDFPIVGRSGIRLATRRRWLVGGCAKWRAPVVRQMLADGELTAVPVGDTGFRLR